MLTLDEARRRLFSGVSVLARERVALGEASGRVLAEPVHARDPLPAFDHSAMDGYALATADFAGAGPWTLAVAGESRAGVEAPTLMARTCCRILTGAPVPSGADAVVAQEDVERTAGSIHLVARPRLGQHIRRTGEDLESGDLALAAGSRITPGAIALAAMVDVAECVVARRPLVTIVCTGNELRGPGERPRPGTIRESNGPALAALARQASATVRIAPIVADDRVAATRAFEEALEGADVLVTVGGVSVGDHDIVRPALEDAGVRLDFWRVAIKPGKPLAVGRRANAYVLGLPGNPASALITFALFGMPLLRALQGDARPRPPRWPARVSRARQRPVGRTEFARVAVREGPDGSWLADVLDNQASGAATSLATSDGLAELAPGDTPLAEGATVPLLRWADF